MKEIEFNFFFHNLKFDGSFLLNAFLSFDDFPFDCFISDLGQWYSITIETTDFTIIFRDSLKILNFSIRQIAKLFSMPISKGTTPLLHSKPLKIRKNWIDYIKKDILILARALYGLFYEEDFSKFTSASEALTEFKRIFKKSGKSFRKIFPILKKPVDEFCRRAYRGGWTFANPVFQNKIIEKPIKIFDINSMYPAIMLNYPLPFGKPHHYFGEPPNLSLDNLVIMKIATSFELKPNHLPTIQIKEHAFATLLNIKKTDYITTSNGQIVELYLTNYDYQLFNKHYNHKTDFIEYYQFKSEQGFFDDYISTYRYKKENAKSPAEKNKAKIMLNSLYGKFGAKITSISKIPYLENGVLKFNNSEPEEVDPNYIPMAVFITSIARYNIITSAQENYTHFLYADTDSLHLLDNPFINLDTHPTEFGKWALEGEAVRAKYLRAKLYIETLITATGNNFIMLENDVKGAGMTPEIKKQVNYSNFKFGQTFKGKKGQKQIKGGTHIYETEFTISEHDRIYR